MGDPTPEQARITGSSAVTRPLAGVLDPIIQSSADVRRHVYSWIYGSRFATMMTFSPELVLSISEPVRGPAAGVRRARFADSGSSSRTS